MTGPVLLCRKTINVQSGAGQMIVSQARCLQDHGFEVSVCCAKFGAGAAGQLNGIAHWSLPKPLRLLLPSRLRERVYQRRAARLRRSALLIDHGQTFADADIAYVHNFPARQFRERSGGYLANERFPWGDAGADTILVANSHMVRRALIETFRLPDDNVIVIYPGYDPARFNPETRGALRRATRTELEIPEDAPLIGLVTSGNFEKRGLDRFLDCFSALRRRHPNLRGLVLGGRRKPRELASNADHKAGRVVFGRVTPAPERYLAALDLLLYPARYEEFGIVVLEAMAMGIPAVTSSAVGASELLGTASHRLVLEAGIDDLATFCRRASELLAQSAATDARLGAALQGAAKIHTHDHHNARLTALLEKIEEPK